MFWISGFLSLVLRFSLKSLHRTDGHVVNGLVFLSFLLLLLSMQSFRKHTDILTVLYLITLTLNLDFNISLKDTFT